MTKTKIYLIHAWHDKGICEVEAELLDDGRAKVGWYYYGKVSYRLSEKAAVAFVKRERKRLVANCYASIAWFQERIDKLQAIDLTVKKITKRGRKQ